MRRHRTIKLARGALGIANTLPGCQAKKPDEPKLSAWPQAEIHPDPPPLRRFQPLRGTANRDGSGRQKWLPLRYGFKPCSKPHWQVWQEAQ